MPSGTKNVNFSDGHGHDTVNKARDLLKGKSTVGRGLPRAGASTTRCNAQFDVPSYELAPIAL